MKEREQIVYLQIRLIRMAAEHWNKKMIDIIDLFTNYDVLNYLEYNYQILHLEGDEAIFEDIKEYLHRKGANIYEEVN